MSSENTNYFTKDNLDEYLKELGKEYRRLNGKSMPAEIILIGGAAIIANYGFRDMTTDVDAVIHAVSSMKDSPKIFLARTKISACSPIKSYSRFSVILAVKSLC